MSIEEIKEQLPHVKAKSKNGKIYAARTFGRKNPFCAVLIDETGEVEEFSWNTIQRAVTGKIDAVSF